MLKNRTNKSLDEEMVENYETVMPPVIVSRNSRIHVKSHAAVSYILNRNFDSTKIH